MKKISFFALFFCLITMSYGQVFLSQDFSGGQMPPTDWSIEGLPAQWSINSGNEAGGTAPEAMFTLVNQANATWLISPLVFIPKKTTK